MADSAAVVVVVVRTSARAIPLAMITMETSIHWSLLLSYIGMGLRLAARGSLIKLASGGICAGGRDQHRYVFLISFSKKRCRGILITCLVSFLQAFKV